MGKKKEEISRELGNLNGLQHSLGIQAMILCDINHLNESINLLKKQEIICREIGNRHSLQTSLKNQADVLILEGEIEQALTILKEQEEICREMNNTESLAKCLMVQATIFFEPAEALKTAKAAYQIAINNGHHELAEMIMEVMQRMEEPTN